MAVYLMAPLGPNRSIEDELNRKHAAYVKKAIFFKYLYYTTRIVAGLAAALLPFIVPYSQILSTIVAAIVAIVTVFDTVLVPRDKWKLFSRTSDQLWLRQVQERGEYEKYKDRIDEILRAEAEDLQALASLQDVLDQLKKQGATPGTRPQKI